MNGTKVQVIDSEQCYSAWNTHDKAPPGLRACWPRRDMIGHIIHTEQIQSAILGKQQLAALVVFWPEENEHLGDMGTARWAMMDMLGLKML